MLFFVCLCFAFQVFLNFRMSKGITDCPYFRGCHNSLIWQFNLATFPEHVFWHTVTCVVWGVHNQIRGNFTWPHMLTIITLTHHRHGGFRWCQSATGHFQTAKANWRWRWLTVKEEQMGNFTQCVNYLPGHPIAYGEILCYLHVWTRCLLHISSVPSSF